MTAELTLPAAWSRAETRTPDRVSGMAVRRSRIVGGFRASLGHRWWTTLERRDSESSSSGEHHRGYPFAGRLSRPRETNDRSISWADTIGTSCCHRLRMSRLLSLRVCNMHVTHILESPVAGSYS